MVSVTPPSVILFALTATNSPFLAAPPAAGHRPEAQENKSGARRVAHRGQLQSEKQVETAEEEREGARRERSAEEEALRFDLDRAATAVDA